MIMMQCDGSEWLQIRVMQLHNDSLESAMGFGVEKDDVEAAKWYGMAGDQSDEVTQCNLGVIYEHGLGVQRTEMKLQSGTGWLRPIRETQMHMPILDFPTKMVQV
ncbi:hypothetical protein M427DRAFT_496295 [Gonapodya prolifera JEL478]|uniref:Uncharacterized protein n=1 Tax=Gonapodya prolifera (strain JEL478) TaxID=1344416 RepID=A0A139AG67_GONPJ|nr:hypothetical protein M427DRAFT_496295 [Gonapodya prolifera JEL478]|eukprot:KXS15801.1 hypothetical protein M427DRAFT_496295 [Gonapodya prolifera JEL478]